MGKSDEIGKWGKYLELVDEVLAKSHKTKSKMDGQIQESIKSETTIKTTEKEEICFRDGTCITYDEFDDVNRFDEIGNCGFAILHRKLMKWFVNFK